MPSNKDASPAEAFMATAVQVYTTARGLRLQYRRLHREDVSDLPNAWPIFKIAIAKILRRPEGEDQPEFVESFDRAFESFGKSDENGVELMCRATVSPVIYNPKKLKKGQAPPEDAIPYWALPEIERDAYIMEIIKLASGLEPADEEAEAERLAGFREDAAVPGGDGVESANGSAGERDHGDTGRVEGDGVGSGDGVRGDAERADRAPTADAATGG